MFAYRLAEQAWHQRGSWDVFLSRPLSQRLLADTLITLLLPNDPPE